VADHNPDDQNVRAKVIQFPARSRRKVRPRRPRPRVSKPPTQLTSSVQLILTRLGLCGAD